MEFDNLLNYRDEWLISNLKKDRYKFGLNFLLFLYMRKYTGKELLRKLKRYHDRLIKWRGAFSHKLYRYDTHEACIRGEEMKQDDTQFNERLVDIESALQSIYRFIRNLQEYHLYEEYIEELKISEDHS